MWKFTVTTGLCLIFASLASTERLVCYYNSKAQERPAQGQLSASDINPKLCTHLIYAFADINGNEIVPASVTDVQQYIDFNALKESNPLLITLLAVGGPNFNTKKFRDMVQTTGNRAIFIQSSIKLLRGMGFDGLTLDWRYPGGARSEQQSRRKFTELCKELSDAFKAEATANNWNRLLLTTSVSAERDIIDDSYEVKEIANYLDFINVLTFDFRGPWEENTGHHSPLFQGSENTGFNIHSNTDSALEYWQAQGAPAEKLNMGLAAYGRAFSLSSDSTDVGAPASGPGDAGCYTGEEGLWSIYESCLYIENTPFQRIVDQQVPYAVVENQWVGLDDETSLAAKVTYLKNNNIGGAVVWSLDLDDFTGEFCNNGKSPFISHLKDLLLSTPPTTTAKTTTPPTTTTTPPTATTAAPPTTTTTPPMTTTTPFTTTTTPPSTKTPPTTTTTTTTAPTTKTKTTTTTPPTTTTTTTTTTPSVSGNLCKGNLFGYFPDPASRHHYYHCSFGFPHHIRCPTGLVFTSTLNVCVFDTVYYPA